ncbi:hypothetical protein BGW39_004660 [Mortierella sp. 14UC]|nr:hypothetical protein BGW39_004660 [Mortierella sp. 14UC]
MVRENSVDDDFEKVVESTAHVYINSFLNMDKPVWQTRVEAKELDRQWHSITQGREEIGLEGDSTYLDAALIKDQGLSVGTAARLDLATFSHVVFAPAMDLERIQRAVKDFAKLFLSRKDFKIKANQKPLQEAYSQLVAVLLALYTRHNRTTPRRITIDDIRNACNGDVISGPINLPELSKGPTLQLARRVANDVKQLESLYSNTLKKVIERVRTKEQSLPHPSDQDAVIELEKEHVKRVADIYKKEPKDKSVDEYKDVVWLVEDEVKDVVASQNKQQDEQGVQMEEAPKKQSSKAPTILTARRAKQQRQPSPQQDDVDMDIDDVPQPPAKLLLAHKSTKTGSSTSGSSAKDHQPVRETRRTSAKEATKKITELEESRKRHKNGSGHENNSEEEEEQEEAARTTKKRKNSKKDSKSKQRQQESSASTSSSSETGESEDESMSDPEPARSATGRRRTRRWTEKEVAQLMALVPQFQYSDSEVIIKKRTTKWAELKAYDRKHGHILRHRNQVMLKDKYREQTDKGQHRQRVHELSRARAAEREKATKEAALKAIADSEAEVAKNTEKGNK